MKKALEPTDSKPSRQFTALSDRRTGLERKAENQREAVDISRRRLVEEEGKMRELEEELEGVIARIEDVRRRLCKVMAEESSGRGDNMGGGVLVEVARKERATASPGGFEVPVKKKKKCSKVGLSNLSRTRVLGWVQWLGEEGGRGVRRRRSSGGGGEFREWGFVGASSLLSCKGLEQEDQEQCLQFLQR